MRRRVGALLLAAALVAACSGGSDGAAGAGSASTTTTTVVGGAPVASSTTAAGGSGTTAGDRGSSVTANPPPSSGSPTIGLLPTGRLAPYLLRPGHGDRIVVEVRAQSGAAPAAATLDHLVRVLEDVSGKQVVVDGPDPVAGGAQAWTAGTLTAAADAAAQLPQGGQQVVLRLLFVRGSYEGDGPVLGVAVRGDVAAVFSDQVAAAAGLLVSPGEVEDAVSVHEVGHLLGLVDIVLQTGRADPDHAGHSRNTGSVMYWAVESDLIGQLLGGDIPHDFDADDRADLATIRNG
jgi:hypothetical protein